MKYTKKQISDYICGWLPAINYSDYNLDTIESALYNALIMVRDVNDGIDNHIHRRKIDSSETPLEVKDFIFDCMEEGAKVFFFEPCDTESAFFIEHNDESVTICSWAEIGEIQYLNIEKNVRNKLAKDLEVKS